jgi:hypothetical protein
VYVRRKSARAGQVPLVQSGRPTWAIGDQRSNHSLSPKSIRLKKSDRWLSRKPYALKTERKG